MKNRKKRNSTELSKGLKHVIYELNMLIAVSNGLSTGVFGKSTLNNAMVESFAIHTRNMIDFLWPEKPTNDHIIAEDYFDDINSWDNIRTPIPEILKNARKRAHKEIAHISYDRIKVKKEEKPWDFIQIMTLISEHMDLFLKSKKESI